MTGILAAGLAYALYAFSAATWRGAQRRHRARSLRMLAVLDSLRRHELDVKGTCRFIARVRVERHTSLLVVGAREVHLVTPRSSAISPTVESFSVAPEQVRSNLGVVRLLLADRHLHLRPADQRSRRQLHQGLVQSLEEIREEAVDAHQDGSAA